MKYIKKYNENIDWVFDEDETPGIPEEFKENQDFYKFLVNNDILDRYIYNFNNDNTIIGRVSDNLKNFLKYEKFFNYIMSAFLWRTTNEGDIFWSKIHKKWVNEYK